MLTLQWSVRWSVGCWGGCLMSFLPELEHFCTSIYCPKQAVYTSLQLCLMVGVAESPKSVLMNFTKTLAGNWTLTDIKILFSWRLGVVLTTSMAAWPKER